MIYVVEAVGHGFYKFGVAVNPVSRLSELQVGCPFELRLIASVDWPHHYEATIHDFLKQRHIRGEWFRDGVQTMLAIQAITASDLDAFLRYYEVERERRGDKYKAAYPWNSSLSRLEQRQAWWRGRDSKQLSRARSGADAAELALGGAG